MYGRYTFFLSMTKGCSHLPMKITDAGLETLASGCTELRDLNLSSNSDKYRLKVTDSISKLLDKCLHLKRLDVSGIFALCG